MDGRPNRRNKAAFSNPSGVVQRERGGGRAKVSKRL